MRTVIPIADENGIQGLIGRTFQPQCHICGYHHFENRNCPNNSLEKLWGSKWKVQKGFKKEYYLYNFHKALSYIQRNKTIVLVESPGNVWRCWENGVRNVVAIFGVYLTDCQKQLLEKILLKKVILLLDNDLAGRQGQERIQRQLERLFIVKTPIIKYGHFNDLGDMDNKYFKETVCPVLQQIG